LLCLTVLQVYYSYYTTVWKTLQTIIIIIIIIIALPRQQWLRERNSMLRLYVHTLRVFVQSHSAVFFS